MNSKLKRIVATLSSIAMLSTISVVANAETGIVGDVNLDGSVKTSDLVVLKKYLLGYDINITLATADIVPDGQVKTSDLLALKKYLLTGESETIGTSVDIGSSIGDSTILEGTQLLNDVSQTYTELWDVILQEQYNDIWTENCANFVGEEDAQATAEMLKSFCKGTVYGQEAIDLYQQTGNLEFCCEFVEGVVELTFDGENISGVDKDGNELFSHDYVCIGYDENLGFFEYQSVDDNRDEFTYFVLRPDTPDTTYHIEFRYGSDLNQLLQYDTGKYAYLMCSGIQSDYTLDTITKAITLFCTENLTDAQ